MPSEYGNGNGNGEYGELEEFREFVEEHGDDISGITLLDMKDGDGYAAVQFEGEWYSYDLSDFDADLWQGLFNFINQYDIDYVVYEG